MNIDALAMVVEAARSRAASFDVLDPKWFEAIATELRLAAEFRHLLLHYPVVTTDNPVVKKMLAEIDIGSCDDAYKTGLGLLIEMVRPEEYLASLAEVILILPVGIELPKHLRSFIDEARQCYALGRFVAVQSLCRIILETTVNELGVLQGEWTTKQLHTKPFRRAYQFEDRVKLVAGEASPKICELYRDLCSVVHGATTSAKTGAPQALTMTVRYVQYLCTLHKEQK